MIDHPGHFIHDARHSLGGLLRGAHGICLLDSTRRGRRTSRARHRETYIQENEQYTEKLAQESVSSYRHYCQTILPSQLRGLRLIKSSQKVTSLALLDKNNVALPRSKSRHVTPTLLRILERLRERARIAVSRQTVASDFPLGLSAERGTLDRRYRGCLHLLIYVHFLGR